jgi:hypothetical protein
MAYLNQDDEENQQGSGLNQVLTQQQPQVQTGIQGAPQEPEQPQQSSTPTMIGGGQSSQTPQSAPAQTAKAPSSGSFTNLKSYLQANQGNRIASAAGQRIQNVGASAQKSIGQAQNVFGQKMEAGSLKNMDKAVGDVRGTAQLARKTEYQDAQAQSEKETFKAQEKARQDYLNSILGSLPENNVVQVGRGGFTTGAGDALLSDPDNKRLQYESELDAIRNRQLPMDIGPNSANAAAKERQKKDIEALNKKFGLDFSQVKADEVKLQDTLLKDMDTQRFADIINARYQGPQNLAEAGVYEPTLRKVRTAQEAANKAETAQGRAQLLKDIFGQSRDYTRGQSALDTLLLNTSQQGIQNIQQKAKETGNVQNQFEQAQNVTRNLATRRAEDTVRTREEAKKAFSEEQSAEISDTEKRLDDLYITPAKDASGNLIPKLDASGKPVVNPDGSPVYQTQWDRLPEQLRNTIRNAEATNKETQNQELKKVDEKYGNINEQMQQSQGAVANLQKQVDDARLKLYLEGASLDGTTKNVNQAKKQKIEQQIKDLETQLSNAKNNLNVTQNTFNQYQTEADAIRNMNLKQVQFSPEEAAILGIQSGEGFYGANADLIKQGTAIRENLVSKNEVVRQQALAQLAALDRLQGADALSTAVKYGLDQAGTQSILDSLDTAGTRNELNQLEQRFRDTATGMNVTGEGSKKNKTSGDRYYATETANLADVLGRAGYDFNAPTRNQVGSREVLANIAGVRQADQDPDTLLGILKGAVAPEFRPQDSAGVYTNDSTLAKKAGYAAADVGSMGITAGLRALGLDATGALMGGVDNILGTSIFGGGTSSKESKSEAAQIARADLQKKLAEELEGQNFYNRSNIVDNEQSRARTAALQQILGGLDMTNVGQAPLQQAPVQQQASKPRVMRSSRRQRR